MQKIVININENDYKTLMINGGNCSVSMAERIIDSVYQGKILPKGHGDLIDRKLALSDDGLCEFHMYDDYVKMRNYLKSIPTIIEADAESEGKE